MHAVATQTAALDPQPDVVVTSAYEPDFRSFIKALRAAGVTSQVIGSDRIDMEIGKGEIVALLGANCAGKSSTMNAVAGLVPVARGRAMFDGRDITDLPRRRSRSRGSRWRLGAAGCSAR